MEFVLVLLPVFSIFAIGFIGQKVIGFDPRSLSKMAIYLLSPFLALGLSMRMKSIWIIFI